MVVSSLFTPGTPASRSDLHRTCSSLLLGSRMGWTGIDNGRWPREVARRSSNLGQVGEEMRSSLTWRRCGGYDVAPVLIKVKPIPSEEPGMNLSFVTDVLHDAV